MSSTFVPGQFASFSALNHSDYTGHIYAWISNPIVQQLCTKVAALERACLRGIFPCNSVLFLVMIAMRIKKIHIND
ncbi:MAG: hypothetical protein ACNYPI_05770 [Arenicellales bacterium WSBS_2016_MAG_OTU3]